ncbi:MAG: hypothetical protein EZS28_033914 [Streblomastix strix]|uniref:Tyr recombinase domain-containing protein n=1 Tax=Streblomastix strix TaxID=222440 RepID=A0A5J4UKE0_9EUKA|nr:MAG: hypothetical protein EZS28_033914 [Streblomastix strix]
MKSERELLQKTIAILAAFTATRMTELAAITRKSITWDGQDMRIMTITKKGKKIETELQHQMYERKNAVQLKRCVNDQMTMIAARIMMWEFGGIMIEIKFQEVQEVVKK